MNIKTVCTKCGGTGKGLKGEVLGGISILIAFPMIYLFGISMVSFVGLGIFLWVALKSSKHVCSSCRKNDCPKCKSKLPPNRYCPNCNIFVCPSCGSYQGKKTNSWIRTILYIPIFILLLLPFFTVLPMVGFAWIMLYALIIRYFTAEQCKNCGDKIDINYLINYDV